MTDMKRGLAAFAIAFALAPAGDASAQGYPNAGGAEPVYNQRSVVLGGGVVVRPKYEGSEDHEVVPIPLIMPQKSESASDGDSVFKKVRRRVKFRGLDDIRVRAVRLNRIELGAVTGYNFGREEDDARRLNGLGDIDGGLVLGGYAGYHLGELLFDVSTSSQVTGDHTGTKVRFGAEIDRQVSSRVSVVARLGTTYASDDYMEKYFSVTPLQSVRSSAALPVFSADGGIKDVHFDLGARIDVGRRWKLKMGGRYSRLVGDAADSPVIETENQWSGTVGLGYKFNLGR